MLVWDVANRRLDKSLTGTPAFISTLVFSRRDDKFLFVGSEDNQIALWDVETGVPR